MAHQPLGIEWHIGEDAYLRGTENSDASVVNQYPVVHSPEIRLALHTVRLLLFAVTALLLVSGIGVSPQQAALEQAENEVSIWMLAAEEARRTDDRDAYEALIDPAVESSWRREWMAALSFDATNGDARKFQLLSVSLDGELIRTIVTTSGPSIEWWRSSPYRETRFFRQSDAGLVRTIPPAAYWGDRETVETAHIRLDYYERDAHLAESIAPQLEAAYLALFELLELDPESEEPKTTILIDKSQPRGWASAGRSHTLTSPYNSKIPVALSNEDFMLQQIVSRLSYMALNEALPNTNRTFVSNWELLIWSIDGWVRTELLQQRTPWHHQAEQALRDNPPEERPLGLAQIGTWRSGARPQQVVMMRDYMIAESVVAFLVETRGQEQIPRLLDGLTRHSNWADLITALYDIPFEEMEAEWNRYLVERFEWQETK